MNPPKWETRKYLEVVRSVAAILAALASIATLVVVLLTRT